jgi:hypothetical protein
MDFKVMLGADALDTNLISIHRGVLLPKGGIDEHFRASPGLTRNEVINQCGGIHRRRAIELLHRHDGSFCCRTQAANRSLLYYPVQAVPKDAREPIRNQFHGGLRKGRWGSLFRLE